MELFEMTVSGAVQALEERRISARDLARSFLKRISEVEPLVKGFISLLGEDQILEQADRVDKYRSAGRHPSPLAGIPLALKDNICTTALATTCASRMLENYQPPYDAHVTEKLAAAGTVLFGKTNMDEFAMGSSTENSAVQETRNPWDLHRVPGGSSGGSAALVAAREVAFALGSDTGGSIRQPASLCGVVGLKPTYGLVSRHGLIAFASSLDQIGPLTRNVEDCARVLEIIAGHDPRDSTSIARERESYSDYIGRDVRGFRVGVPGEFLEQGITPGVKEVIRKALEYCAELQIDLHDVSMPHSPYALSAYYLVATAEASSNLARYDGIQYGYRARDSSQLQELYQGTRSEGFGQEVKRRVMLGTYALSSGYYDAYYLKALKVRTLIRRDFDEAFAKYDFLITPTSPTVAFQVGEKIDDPLTMYLNDVYTTPANLAGVPAISIPCGFSDDLPVGLQVIGRPFDEGRLLQLAHALETVLGFQDTGPAVHLEGGPV